MQEELRARVVVDAMGSFSPIANQSRGGTKPDSVVLMVGSCAKGLPDCSAADLLYSFSPLNRYAEFCTRAAFSQPFLYSMVFIPMLVGPLLRMSIACMQRMPVRYAVHPAFALLLCLLLVISSRTCSLGHLHA